ncbi:hypothetical protein S40285_10616 [Stachybotrys chlorohalonatus IBT 40285]|uniref:Uncharacterized protein n=1 Tax=Stachybotrys chlorohalonatus (strain IBT 40285) TaxID=1283841 RepID=A0A084QYF0_STAC4|nr:hypothetical protein S40285_10616 [Stachybotrys chlorohalonata IBT 40285]
MPKQVKLKKATSDAANPQHPAVHDNDKATERTPKQWSKKFKSDNMKMVYNPLRELTFHKPYVDWDAMKARSATNRLVVPRAETRFEVRQLKQGTHMPDGVSWPNEVGPPLGRVNWMDRAALIYETHAPQWSDMDRRLFIELLPLMVLEKRTKRGVYEHSITKGYYNDHSVVRIPFIWIMYGWSKFHNSKLAKAVRQDYPDWVMTKTMLPETLPTPRYAVEWSNTKDASEEPDEDEKQFRYNF